MAVDTLYCVTSSADANLGCFIDRASAEERQRSTGQQRLLDVIGQTARLEQRPVLAIVPPEDPAYATTQVTCATDEATAGAGVLVLATPKTSRSSTRTRRATATCSGRR